MEVIIENLIKRLADKPEDKLPDNTGICFKFKGYTLTVREDTETGNLAITKTHGIDDTISISPRGSNKIIIS